MIENIDGNTKPITSLSYVANRPTFWFDPRCSDIPPELGVYPGVESSQMDGISITPEYRNAGQNRIPATQEIFTQAPVKLYSSLENRRLGLSGPLKFDSGTMEDVDSVIERRYQTSMVFERVTNGAAIFLDQAKLGISTVTEGVKSAASLAGKFFKEHMF